MDIFSMLQNATIYDKHTDEPVGQAVGFEVACGRLYLTAVMFESVEEVEPDDGDKEEIPQPEPKPVDAVAPQAGTVHSLRAVVNGHG